MIHLAAADRVELVLHLGRELVVDQLGQMGFEQLRNGERGPSGHQHVAAAELEHVLAGEDRVDDRRVGARPADAHLLQRPGQRGFAVAIRRLRRVALRLQRRAPQRLAQRNRRQHRLAIGQIGLGIVRAFDVRPEIAGKLDRLADGLERRPVDLDADGDAVSAGVGHLAGDRPLPDQVVELELVGTEASAERFREVEIVAGGPNRLVGLLRVLHLRLIHARRRRQVFVAVLRSDQTPGRLDRHRGQRGRVGSHVRDVAVLVKALGHLHRVPGGESVLAVRLLLQRAGRKGRIGARACTVCLPGSPPGMATERSRSSQFRRLTLVEQQQSRILQVAGGRIEVAAGRDLSAPHRDQLGLEGRAARLGEASQQVPERGRLKGHPLSLTLDDQPYRDALHPAGRKPRADLPPQKWGYVVAIKAINDSPHLLGAHQIVVNLPRTLQRVEDRFLGDFVEDESMDGHPGMQDFAEVPTDGFSFAIFIRGQKQFAGPFQQTLEFANLLAFGVWNDVNRFKAVVYIDSQIGPVLFLVLFGDFLGALRQVADMADACLDRVTAAQKLADGPGFGRGFNNHQRDSADGVGFLRHDIPGNLGRVCNCSTRFDPHNPTRIGIAFAPKPFRIKRFGRWRPAAFCDRLNFWFRYEIFDTITPEGVSLSSRVRTNPTPL